MVCKCITHQIDTNLYARQIEQKKVSNFPTNLPSPQSELALETMKGYNLIRGSGKSTWRVNLADNLSVAHNKACINRVMRLKKPI